VWRWQAGAREPWRQFTAADGLGDDDAYALTIDRAQRAWAVLAARHPRLARGRG
jgi:hypothetical protein